MDVQGVQGVQASRKNYLKLQAFANLAYYENS